MAIELLVLRAVHILAGTFWVGAGLFSSFFLMPALGSAGPAAAASVMEGMQRRHLFTVMPLAAVLTIASGARLIWLGYESLGEHYFHTRMGHVFTVSGIVATLVFVLAMVVVRPTMLKAGALAAQLATVPPGSPERAAMEQRVNALRTRGSLFSVIATGLLVLSALGMSVARYL